MTGSVQENTIKFNEALIEELIPKMPKKGQLRAKLAFCAAYAERQAKLQEQLQNLEAEKEYNRKLKEGL